MTEPSEQSSKEPLSPERIELAALAVIQNDGLSAFSIRRLAAELGCKPMSIYHYFPSKGHLMDALVDPVVEELLPLPPASLPWRERILQAALSWRRMALRQPGMFLFLSTHRLNTPRSLQVLEALIGLCRTSGASEEDAIRLFRAIGYYLVGAGIEEAAGYDRGPSTVAPVTEAVMRRDYPNVAAAARYFAPDAREATFRLGIKSLIDGWLQRVQPRAATDPTCTPPESLGPLVS